MSYLPDAQKLAGLGFGPAEQQFNTRTYFVPDRRRAVVVYWREGRVRLCHLASGTWWVPDFTGPVADEAAFDALAAMHFPDLITPQA